ncbi:hypothetical protein AVEN_81802-1 [Araneus ventricosus]|uniref:Gustatory receptor n=1 Tax=Araneus ventricosus TaxID=182803 RepID=A0A4Y2JYX2_ARAVE|nr:hypothetical protein AVEN_81802-1 [Araneus ventricosus]
MAKVNGSLVFNILCWLGLVDYPNSSWVNRMKTSMAQFVFAAGYVDTIAIYLTCFDNLLMPKLLAMEQIISIVSSAAVMVIMTRQRKQLTSLLANLSFLGPLDYKKVNIMLLCLCILPFAYASSMLICFIRAGKEDLLFLNHYILIENKALKFSIYFYKLFMMYVVFPTLTNLVSLVYSISCLICHKSLEKLCLEVEDCSPKELTTKKLVEFLQNRNRIIKVLKEIQSIFSTATFIICTANFMACFSNFGQVITYSPVYVELAVCETVNVAFLALVSMMSIFYYAGLIPMDMQRFTDILREHYEQRALLGIVPENSALERLVFEEKTFLLSGCDLIFYRKDTITTALGTILNYGLLILSIELKR